MPERDPASWTRSSPSSPFSIRNLLLTLLKPTDQGNRFYIRHPLRTRSERLEQAIEFAIDALNRLDGDAEAEDHGDAEPSGEAEKWVQPATL